MIKEITKSLPKNNRLTIARELIWKYIIDQQKPLDYIQILSYLNENGFAVNKTTVYRQLDFLQKNGLIQEIDLGEGKKRYELASSHHHHLFCTECGKIECIKLEENFSPQLSEISKLTNFKVTEHILNFLGLCKDCQNKIEVIKNV